MFRLEYKLLSRISSKEDISSLNTQELGLLCEEIRDCLINTVSKNGGHLASNLGTVELTVALYRAFNFPKDKLIFDVGHQCYTHKLLSGRLDKFDTLRKEGGISGFMRPDESEYDTVVTGHSSTALSSALGICKALELSGDNDSFVVSVVGDGATTGGLFFEGLNNAGTSKNSSLIVVLNDNKISISKNVGALAKYLSLIRLKPGYYRFKHNTERVITLIPLIGKWLYKNTLRLKNMLKNAIYHSNIFEDMGFIYLGPVDGHNLKHLEQILFRAKEQQRPVLVHVLTKKGKGYSFAENSPKNYHGVSAFDIENGVESKIKADYSAVVGDELIKIAEKDKKLCVTTAAMTMGTGLYEFSQKFKDRFFDVGIAESHAVTFNSGLASGGMHPVFAVYSTFLQRGYDQIIHDTAIAKLPVTFCVDRAGFVGDDGETHQGLFDIAFLKTVPGMEIYSPTTYLELRKILRNVTESSKNPTAIRYPKGVEPKLPKDFLSTEDDFTFYGDCTAKTVIVTFGKVFANAAEAYAKLKNDRKKVAILKLNKLFPILEDTLKTLLTFKNIVIFEEGIKVGGINETIISGLKDLGYKGSVKVFAVNNEFVPQASVDSQLKKYKMDAESIYEIIKEI